MAFVPVYILILFFTIIIDYIAGIAIENAEGKRRRLFLAISIIANVGILVFFKYYNFFAENTNALFHTASLTASVPLLNIMLPLGLSFHTFQAMSYTIEVYRGGQKAERHLGIYALYVMFFPQMVAGPIERPQNIIHQFYERHKLEYDNVAVGVRLILWGMFKKVVIADRLGLVVDPIFNNPNSQSGTTLAIAAIFFAFQIFCDFSAYSDIALGSARVLGIRLMVNFDRPFSAKSVSEFWRRWHISLSAWLNDYVFTPFITKYRRWGNGAIVAGILITWLLCGFWHGAEWKFIWLGLGFGIAIVYEFLTRDIRKKVFSYLPGWLNGTLSRLITVGYFALIAVFFRAANVKESFYIIKKIAGMPGELVQVIRTRKLASLNLPGLLNVLMPCVLLITVLELAHLLQVKADLPNTFNKKPKAIRWAIYYSAVLVIFFFGVFKNHQFIYFQF